MKRLLSLFVLVLLTGCIPVTGTTTLQPGYDIVQVHTSWDDAGCLVTINGEEYVMTTDDTVDVTTLGETIITYTYESEDDSYTCKRVVKVIDDIAPTIELNPGVDTIVVGTDFVDAGVVVEDNYSNNLEVLVESDVNTDVVGTYHVVYTTTDEAGNTTSLVRIVTVVNET